MGARLIKPDFTAYRYGRAGTKLKRGLPVYANVRDEDMHWEGSRLITDNIPDLIWGNLSSTGPKGTALGFAVVDVKPGQYCWIRYCWIGERFYV